jgi:hypothetical protein
VIDHDKYVYQDPDIQLRKQAQELQWGITTINEERKKAGLEAIEGGDTAFVPAGYVPLSTAIAPPPTPSATSNKEVGQVKGNIHLLKQASESDDPFADNEEYCKKFWKSYDNVAAQATTLMTRSLQTEFDALEEEVLANLDDALDKALTKDNTSSARLFDVSVWKERFASSMSGDVETLLTDTMQQAAKDVGENWDDIESQFDASVRAALRESTDRITTSVDTVKAELQQLLEDMYDKPVEEIQAAIMQKFAHYTASRALMIARTTATFALTFAQMTVWKDLGYTYTWLSQRDGKTRDTHKVADMQEPDKDGYFKVGSDRMKHPGGGSQPKENVHCRCVLRPRKK